MAYNYEKFLKNKRRDYNNLKDIHKTEEKVEKYWEELGEHKMPDEEFKKWKSKLLYDHTWQTGIEAIIRYGKIKDGEKILDVGCGWGRMLVGLKKYFPKSDIFGVDKIPDLLKKAKETIKEETGSLNKVELLVGNINKLPFEDDYFDKVISVRVLQYVSDPSETVKELYRVTKKNGRVIITVPNKLNPRQALRYHTKLYKPSDVFAWFKKNYFTDIEVGTIRFLPRLKHKPSAKSKIRIVEQIGSNAPLVNKFGGLIIASGKK